MEQKIQKDVFVSKIISCELIAVNCPYYKESPCDWQSISILTNSPKISDNSSIGNYTGAGPKSENGQFKIFHIINFRALKNSIYRVLVY